MSAFRRATRKQYSPEEKIRVVLDGLKGEDGIAELCRREGIAQSLHYSWSKEFLEAGKKHLVRRRCTTYAPGDILRLHSLATTFDDGVQIPVFTLWSPIS